MKNFITFLFVFILAAGMMPVMSLAETAPITVSCSASYAGSYIHIGDNVTWNTNVSGGDGNYIYTWSGDDGLSGGSASVSKSYTSAGDKGASVTVADHSGNLTPGTDCSVVTVLAPLTFSSCQASEVTGMTGQLIAWDANISGGVTPYNVTWSGDVNTSETNPHTTITYNATGTKSASVVKVTSPDNEAGVSGQSCGSVTIDTQPTKMTATCSAGVSTLNTGHAVTWTANVSGGNGPYTINWSGSDGLSGNGTNISKTYSTAGSKSAQMDNVSSSDGQVITNIACGTVTVNSTNQGGDNGSGGSIPVSTTTATTTSTTTGSTSTSTATTTNPIVSTTTVAGNNTGANTVGLINTNLKKVVLASTSAGVATATLGTTSTSTVGSNLASVLSSGFYITWKEILGLAILILVLLGLVWYFFIWKKNKKEEAPKETPKAN